MAPSLLSLYPGKQAHPFFPSTVVTQSCVHFVPFSHSLFLGHCNSSSPFGQSFCPSQTCFLLMQNSVELSFGRDPLQANFDSSQTISHLDSSSPWLQSLNPSQTQVFLKKNCGSHIYYCALDWIKLIKVVFVVLWGIYQDASAIIACVFFWRARFWHGVIAICLVLVLFAVLLLVAAVTFGDAFAAVTSVAICYRGFLPLVGKWALLVVRG